MTLQLSQPALTDPAPGGLRIATSPSSVRWMSPAAGLWVASRHGEHAGMVERIDGVYHARNARGRELGGFEDLDSARGALDRAETAGGAPRGVLGMLLALNGGIAAIALLLGYLIVR